MFKQFSLKFALLALLALSFNLGLPSSANAQTIPPSGECNSPKDAMLQVLYFAQPGRTNAEEAAKCIEYGKIPWDPQHAVALKQVLDLKNLYVQVEKIPGNSDYKDPDSGDSTYAYFPRLFPELKATRIDGQWKIESEALRIAVGLYAALVPFDIAPLLKNLPQWMLDETFGIYPWQIFACLALILLAIMLQKVSLAIISGFLARNKSAFTGDILQAIAVPTGLIVASVLFTFLLPVIEFPVQIHMALMFVAQILKAVGLIWLGFNGATLISKAMQRRAEATESKLDDQLVPLVRRLLKVVVAIFGVIVVLRTMNVDVESLLAGLGIGGLAFALAAKDTLSNLFGSMTVFVDKPFQVGDAVAIGSSVNGVIEEVGFRTTRVRTYEKTLLTLPNGMITNSVIENLSERPVRRYRTTLGLTYNTTASQVTAFCEGLEHIIESTPELVPDNKTVEFTGFGPSALDILVVCYVDTAEYAKAMRAQHNFNLAVLQLAESLGVSFAFPTQTLHVDSVAEAQSTPLATVTGTPDSIASEFANGGPSYQKMVRRKNIPEKTED